MVLDCYKIQACCSQQGAMAHTMNRKHELYFLLLFLLIPSSNKWLLPLFFAPRICTRYYCCNHHLHYYHPLPIQCEKWHRCHLSALTVPDCGIGLELPRPRIDRVQWDSPKWHGPHANSWSSVPECSCWSCEPHIDGRGFSSSFRPDSCLVVLLVILQFVFHRPMSFDSEAFHILEEIVLVIHLKVHILDHAMVYHISKIHRLGRFHSVSNPHRSSIDLFLLGSHSIVVVIRLGIEASRIH
mmetsp:Transcript_9146/g.21800  ORF Transcript_9146/g.21800 Transcript_9146/m.21800 type:complete len:241 (+) Transcript_9146:294-1016(+)